MCLILYLDLDKELCSNVKALLIYRILFVILSCLQALEDAILGRPDFLRRPQISYLYLCFVPQPEASMSF